MSATAPPLAALPATAAHRVIFVDLSRALAVIFMIQGHAIDALLAPAFRQGALYDSWLFLRGLTSCLFLTLSGFAFSIATIRHWAAHTTWGRGPLRRVRRFGFFVLLGYGLHYPVSHAWQLAAIDTALWRYFLQVDVLQTIGVSLMLLQLLVLLAGTPRRFGVICLGLATAIVLATPIVWRVEWTRWLPLLLAAYLSPATGSIFPLFPWTAFLLLGAALGQLYAHWGAAHLGRFENRVLIAGGALAVVTGVLLAELPYQPLGPVDFWKNSPNLFLIRAGSVLLILGGVAHLSRWVASVPHLVGALAQESLTIYFLHLCVLYGSPWNVGLRQWFGTTLSPPSVLVVIVLVVVAMTLVASAWNSTKHARRETARLTRWVAAAILVGGIL
jgi:uncharacterized membrane protein